ncbi:PEP-CTERM sorting domain-containing protein [Sandaracinobacter neustonicus]|uniref:PEP-CTERM sorting domain-containing protein n=1 Tax=Sandaracinobacter neustonicus TaxID=1715348 RepID=A0A501XN50_9SPHN|nr:NF038132 family protein [Sandaracinobacter neustonicus]TPE61567.1 PEP-CTERM sorting domain-containing protein [Sandaracinobacter neustonicus]
MRILTGLLLGCASFVALSSTPASAATCFGNCGETNINGGQTGSVGVPPLQGDNVYYWVSTNGGSTGGGTLPGQESGSTNGSRLVSDSFYAAAGQKVSYYFNYITSDGAGYADYSWSQLRDVNDSSNVTNLFTARTKPSGTIVPGLDLPDVEATLSPATVLIKPGTTFAPLGDSSGACWSAGCGNTGWIYSEYTIQTSGTYELVFGVSNWDDTAFDSALAFDGLLIGGIVIGDGSSPTNPLAPTDLQPDGSFVFSFEVTQPEQPVFIDPYVAVGYEYEVIDGSLAFSQAWFGDVGDPDGYQIWGWDGADYYFLTDITAETWYAFASPVTKFKLLGIDSDLGLDPEDPNAFVSGFIYNGTGKVDVSMKPITEWVEGGGGGVVPEPATWAMMILGFGAVGLAARRRRSHSVTA